jgi:hypothetical protein
MTLSRAPACRPCLSWRIGSLVLALPTAAFAVGHPPEHPTMLDLVVQAALVVFLAALFINVVLSVVAIFGNEETSEPADGRLTSPPERNPSLAEPAAKAPEAKVD